MKTPSWFLRRNFTAYMLWPLSILYRLASRAVFYWRQETGDRRQETGDRKVVCIGNILAGGVGKTPIVKMLASWLDAPVVMRGYKGGDEAKMLSNAGLKVYVGDRRKNIEKLKSKSVVIMDDGFQNPTIKKNISILVFDGKIGAGNGFMLPAGPLREPMSAIRRADAVVVIGRQETGDKRQEFIKTIEKHNKPIFYAQTRSVDPSAESQSGGIVAFAGIGYPQKFFDALRDLYGDRLTKTVPFPDHYQYIESDLQKLQKMADLMHARLVTTEKDWVRLPRKNKNKIQFIPQQIEMEPAFYEWLKGRID